MIRFLIQKYVLSSQPLVLRAPSSKQGISIGSFQHQLFGRPSVDCQDPDDIHPQVGGAMSSLLPADLAMRRIPQHIAAGPASPIEQAHNDDDPYEDISDVTGAADHGSNSSSPPASETSEKDDFHHESSGQHFNHDLALGMAAEATTYNASGEADVLEGDSEEEDDILHNVHALGFLYPDNLTEIRASEPGGKQYFHIRVH